MHYGVLCLGCLYHVLLVACVYLIALSIADRGLDCEPHVVVAW
jgi:hypothetical protein